jgi:hypothetical protein
MYIKNYIISKNILILMKIIMKKDINNYLKNYMKKI